MTKDLITQIIEFESGRLTTDEIVDLFQELIDSNTLVHLQGHYHRVAEQLSNLGLVEFKHGQH